MYVSEKRRNELRAALQRLKAGQRLSADRLHKLLGEEAYRNYQTEWAEQRELRQDLKNPPKVIVEYQNRLRDATFAHNRADAASGQGRYAAAKKLKAISDTKFEHLLEFLEENFDGQAGLACWLDRHVRFDLGYEPSLCPDAFPVVVTSRSLRNEGGGLLSMKRTKRQVKIDAVERELENLLNGEADEDEIAERLAAGRNLRALATN